MTDGKTPRERITASLQLKEAVDHYLRMEAWTPVMAALLMCGIHPPPGCADIPNGGAGLDGAVYRSGANDRFHDAIRVLKAWRQSIEDGHVGADDCLPPYKFLVWCEVQIEEEGLRVDRKWMDFLLDVAYGPAPQPNDIIPAEVAEHTSAISASLEGQSKANVMKSNNKRAEPPKILTSEIIRLFSRLPHRKKHSWHRVLDTPPKGLESARPDAENGIEALWNPVLVAEWMWGQRGMAIQALDMVFLDDSLELWCPDWQEKKKWIDRTNRQRRKKYSVSP